MKDVTMTLGGVEIEGVSADGPTFNDGPIELDFELEKSKWNRAKGFHCGNCTIELLMTPEICWFFKNDFFLKNRPPRGMQK